MSHPLLLPDLFGDELIVEQFTTVEGVTRSIPCKANTQIYIQVITIAIADQANQEGTTILDGMLADDWQAVKDLLWPKIPKPPKSYWALFKNASSQP